MPAYRAERTLERTYRGIPRDIVDDVILVDDASNDQTVAVAERLGFNIFIHVRNLGYGANQKTCYREALRLGADIVVMLHADYQYEPRLVTAMAAMLGSEIYDVALGSRILGNSPFRSAMPIYKYISNRLLTFIQNLLIGAKLSEYHTGYRAFTRKVLEELPFMANSDDFVFDNQIITQAIAFGFRVGEISCPTKYFPEASSINFRRSVVYGLGVLKTSILYRLWKWGLISSRLFEKRGTFQLTHQYYRQDSLMRDSTEKSNVTTQRKNSKEAKKDLTGFF
jgi:glycosyltransferase involved in cell wall biosynthesis